MPSESSQACRPTAAQRSETSAPNRRRGVAVTGTGAPSMPETD